MEDGLIDLDKSMTPFVTMRSDVLRSSYKRSAAAESYRIGCHCTNIRGGSRRLAAGDIIGGSSGLIMHHAHGFFDCFRCMASYNGEKYSL